jgi:chromosome segregation ATPase
LTQKFFESIASRVKESFETANRDVEAWLKAIIAPLEGQIREHQTQLRRRLESIRHIQDASETLEERIGEVNSQQAELEEYHAHLLELNQRMMDTLHASVDEEQVALQL